MPRLTFTVAILSLTVRYQMTAITSIKSHALERDVSDKQHCSADCEASPFLLLRRRCLRLGRRAEVCRHGSRLTALLMLLERLALGSERARAGGAGEGLQ